jgi:YVTN family beta-propeller protein
LKTAIFAVYSKKHILYEGNGMKKINSIFSFLILTLLYSSFLLGQPVVTNVSPNFGPASGGNTVTITGTGFTGATAVDFGTTPALFTFNSDTSITATAPVGATGDVNIFVTAPTGTSAPTHSSLYVYQGSWLAYIPQVATNNVSPLNISTNTIGTLIPVGLVPEGVAINPTGTIAYITNTESGTVEPIFIATNTTGTPIPLGAESPVPIAITPNGNFAYIADEIQANVAVVDLTTNTLVTTIPIGGQPDGLAITPNGQFVYVSNLTSTSVSVISTASNTVLTTIPIGSTSNDVAINPSGTTVYVTANVPNGVVLIDTATNTDTGFIPLGAGNTPGAIAITPNGQFAYVCIPANGTVIPITLATNTPGTPITVSSPTGNPNNIAITPDSQTAYVVNPIDNSIAVINIPTNTLVTTIPEVTGSSAPLDIAITPDQAPVAEFTFTSPNTFNASASVSPVGTIASYTWNFGDGTTAVTTSPIITHNYLHGGNYTVTLTVTNTAGTSTTQTFTGKTVSNNGGPNATLSQTISVPVTAPPTHFVGFVIKNKFLTQTDYIHKLRWTPSTDPAITEYLLYRNGTLIAIIPATGPFVYLDHNRSKHKPDTYMLIAVDQNGIQSQPVTVVVPH